MNCDHFGPALEHVEGLVSLASRWSGVMKNALCVVVLRVLFQMPFIGMNSGE
jgi:hypothetical protein